MLQWLWSLWRGLESRWVDHNDYICHTPSTDDQPLARRNASWQLICPHKMFWCTTRISSKTWNVVVRVQPLSKRCASVRAEISAWLCMYITPGNHLDRQTRLESRQGQAKRQSMLELRSQVLSLSCPTTGHLIWVPLFQGNYLLLPWKPTFWEADQQRLGRENTYTEGFLEEILSGSPIHFSPLPGLNIGSTQNCMHPCNFDSPSTTKN